MVGKRAEMRFQAPHLPQMLGFSTFSWGTYVANPDPQENSSCLDKRA